LGELPDQPYVFAGWKRCRRVAPNYHVAIDAHWYSTPNRLIRELVNVRIADKTVEVFRRGQRIASHARAPNRRGHTTIADQMPSAHRRYGKWTPGGLIAAGEKIGPSTAAFFQVVIEARPHPEQGFRTCLGVLSLARSYDNARVDAACRRGILIKARSSPRFVRSSRAASIALSSARRPTTSPCATATSAARAISTEPVRLQC
jgi:transposase